MTAVRNFWLRVTVALTTVAMVAFNIYASTAPLFDRSTGEISEQVRVLVTPAGYVFSIWGLIYLAMLAYSAAQFLGPLKDSDLPDRLAFPVMVSNGANITWLILWHSLLFVWTVPVMLVLLGSLIVAYLTARAGRPHSESALERWAVRAPISLYLGWVSVATIANISNTLRSIDWDGFGVPEPAWAVVVLLVGAVLAVLGLLRHLDVVFAGVFVWAYVGIAVETPSDPVTYAAYGLAALIGAGAVLALVRRTTRAAR